MVDLKDDSKRQGRSLSMMTRLLIVLGFALICCEANRCEDSLASMKSYEYTTYVAVDVVGNPKRLRAKDYSLLEETFMNVYNAKEMQRKKNKIVCDSLHRRIKSVYAQLYKVNPSKIKQQKRPNRLPMTFLFQVTFQCHSNSPSKCQRRGNLLFEQTQGILKKNNIFRHQRILQEEDEIEDEDEEPPVRVRKLALTKQSWIQEQCHCKRIAKQIARSNVGRNVSWRAPRPREFSRAFHKQLRQGYNDINRNRIVRRILNAWEVEIIPQCNSDIRFFTRRFKLDFFSKSASITKTAGIQRDLLEDVLMSSYNLYSDITCNGKFPKFIDVSLSPQQDAEQAPPAPMANPQANEEEEEFDTGEGISGGFGEGIMTCRGCTEEGTDAGDNDGFRRLLQSINNNSTMMMQEGRQLTGIPFRGSALGQLYNIGNPNVISDSDCFCASQRSSNPNRGIRFLDSLTSSIHQQVGGNDGIFSSVLETDIRGFHFLKK